MKHVYDLVGRCVYNKAEINGASLADAPGCACPTSLLHFLYTHSSFYSEADRIRLTRFIASLSDLTGRAYL